MPLEPPWPVEVLDLLRAAQVVLQRAQKTDPRDPAIGAITTDVDAAVAKLEALTRSQA
jgi:hypothetical protein